MSDNKFQELNSLAYSLECLELKLQYVENDSPEQINIYKDYCDTRREFIKECAKYFLDDTDWDNLRLDELDLQRQYNNYDD